RRLGEHTQPAERPGNRDELRWILGDELAREPVEARDAALAVVAGQARVGRALAAGEAVPAGPADGRGDEVAAREPGTVLLDERERLVPEHQRPRIVRCDAEQA